MTDKCLKLAVQQMRNSSCFFFLLLPQPLSFCASAADAVLCLGVSTVHGAVECRCTLCTTGVFVLLSLSSVCRSPSPFPCWGSAPAETFLELPPSSCMERSYCSFSHFSQPLCLYPITLWSLITCADAWDADGPANGARAVNLCYWDQFCHPSLWP